MATNTYTALRTTTLTSSVSSVTLDLTGITGYTDLVIVSSVSGDRANTLDSLAVRFNGSSNAYYSYTYMYGDGSSAVSGRASSQTNIWVGNFVSNNTANNYSPNVIQINNYSNTTTYKTVLARGNNNGAIGATNANIGLWKGDTGSSTEAITSVTLRSETGNNFLSGSTFTVYGIAAAPAFAAKATGGTISYGADGYIYHTFTSSGTFTPSVPLTCDYLVIAGGAGGGGWLGGGGGAGGLRSTVQATGGGGTIETALSLSATGYTVTVGAGGAGGPYSNPSTSTAGSNSVFSTITSLGGGAASGYAPANGFTGGSGGGAGGANSSTTGGAGTTNQGYAGGNCNPSAYGAGGGGGAGAVGQTAYVSDHGGAGGNGVALTQFANVTGTGSGGYYAGGGGAHGNAGGGAGGAGGGGAGVTGYTGAPGGAGAGNTGSGGGGGRDSAGGAGGSGIVIIRYAN